MTDRVGWGVIGTGTRGREVMIPALLASSTSEIIGVCGSDVESAKEAVKDLPELEVFASVEEMLIAPAIEVIYIATPHYHHVPQAVQAIEAGKHVFMEPPMSLSVDGAHKLVEKARAMGVRLGIAFQHRFHTAALELKKVIDGQEIGEIKHIGVSLSEPVDLFFGLVGRHLRSGPAALLRLGVHAVDLVSWLSPEPVAQTAAMAREEGENRVNTMVTAALKFRDGVLGSMTCAACFADRNLHAVIEGEKARIELSGDLSGAGPASIIEHRDGGSKSREFEPEDPVGRMIDAFNESVSGGAEFHPDGADGKDGVRITCALIESIKSRRSVKIFEVAGRAGQTGD